MVLGSRDEGWGGVRYSVAQEQRVNIGCNRAPEKELARLLPSIGVNSLLISYDYVDSVCIHHEDLSVETRGETSRVSYGLKSGY
jgi:hypothetical protein